VVLIDTRTGLPVNVPTPVDPLALHFAQQDAPAPEPSRAETLGDLTLFLSFISAVGALFRE
jgi:hypothetical protein